MFSVSGMVDIGINMDRDLIEDPTCLGRFIEEAFVELKDTRPTEKKKTKKRPPLGTP